MGGGIFSSFGVFGALSILLLNINKCFLKKTNLYYFNQSHPRTENNKGNISFFLFPRSGHYKEPQKKGFNKFLLLSLRVYFGEQKSIIGLIFALEVFYIFQFYPPPKKKLFKKGFKIFWFFL